MIGKSIVGNASSQKKIFIYYIFILLFTITNFITNFDKIQHFSRKFMSY